MRGRWEFDDEPAERRREPAPISRGETSGAVLAAGSLLYAFVQRDIPVFFIAAAFLVWQLRGFTGQFKPATAAFARNVLQGLSLSLFIGAVLLLLGQ